jgi:hypothetical protein
VNKRSWCYVQRPRIYEIAPCACGNADPDWSEFEGHLWCPACKIDFIPKHGGIFDGPVGVMAMDMLGIYFDRIDLIKEELTLLPDWEGKSHFVIDGDTIKLRPVDAEVVP